MHACIHAPTHTHTHILKRKEGRESERICAYMHAHVHEHKYPFSFSSFYQPVIVERNDSFHSLQKFKQKNVICKNHQPSGREKKILFSFF